MTPRKCNSASGRTAWSCSLMMISEAATKDPTKESMLRQCAAAAPALCSIKKRGSREAAPSITMRRDVLDLLQTLDQVRLAHVRAVVRLVLHLGLRRHGLIAPARLRFTV